MTKELSPESSRQEDQATAHIAAIDPESSIALSIIIVSWNVRELLADSLRSIDQNRGQIQLEVIVVDSGSSDGTPAMIQKQFPWVRLLDCHENVGFPKGNNLGLAAAKGSYLLLLNPDTVIVEDALRLMVEYLDENPGVGAVGGKLLNLDGSVQSSRRRFPTLATAAFESTWLQPYAPRGLLRRYYMDDVPDDIIVDVDWLVGACLMVRRESVAQVGLLDEEYFMYSEELDWCRRIKRSGWRIVYLPTARVIHHVGKSSEQAVTRRHVDYQRAKLRYFYKFHGPSSGALLRVILLLNYLWQLLVEAGKYLLGHRREMRRQRVSVYWQVLRTGLRPAGY